MYGVTVNGGCAGCDNVAIICGGGNANNGPL